MPPALVPAHDEDDHPTRVALDVGDLAGRLDRLEAAHIETRTAFVSELRGLRKDCDRGNRRLARALLLGAASVVACGTLVSFGGASLIAVYMGAPTAAYAALAALPLAGVAAAVALAGRDFHASALGVEINAGGHDRDDSTGSSP